MPDELEITENPDGTTEMKVITSTTDCKEVMRPFKKAKGGEIISQKRVHNPGVKTGQQIRRQT